ncbi:MAG TPA: hypothetical protein VKT72_07820 [Candidatus Baltobacteraceae bacterium]|nr:hypothetical protein [Candidatus Baltobacteraceae bacterium]
MSALLTLVLALGGAEPAGGVVDGGDALYGAALVGGPHCLSPSLTDLRNIGCGVIYRIKYDGSGYAVIHAFDGSDGKRPYGPLQLGPDGGLYGRAQIGDYPHSATELYSLNRNGSNFRVLYSARDLISDTPFTITPSLDVYATARQDDGSVAIVRIGSGRAQVISTYPSDAVVTDLRSEGGTVYALLINRRKCGSEIHRIDDIRDTVVLTSLADPNTPACDRTQSLIQILPLPNGDVLAISNRGLVRIHAGSVVPVYVLSSTWKNRFGDADEEQPRTLSRSRDGRISMALSRVLGTNCGTILSFDETGAFRSESILPGDRQSADIMGCVFSVAPSTVDARGNVYGITDGTGCEAGRGGLAASPLRCGSVFAVAAGIPRTIHAFGAAIRYDTAATPPPRYVTDALLTTADPLGFALTRTASSDALPFAAVTPSPMPLAFKSDATAASVPLTFEGRVSAPWIYPPFTLLPALIYRAPPIAAGMYESPFLINASTQRMYFPHKLHSPGRLHDGERFLALAGLNDVHEAMTDASGKTLGTSTLTLLAHRNGVVRFRVNDTQKTLQFPGAYAMNDGIPGLTPTADDDVTDFVRTTYAHKLAYVRRLAAVCVQLYGDATSMTFYSGELRVRAVYRIVATAPLSMDASGSDAAAFTAVDPLVIVFDTPVDANPTFSSGNGATMTSFSSSCTAMYALAADPWQLERMFSLHPPIDPLWPPAYRKAVQQHTVIPGMTHEMVAAAIGYPPVYGTPEEFDKLDDWKYVGPAPDGQEVVFKNGRVVRYDPPEMLP